MGAGAGDVALTIWWPKRWIEVLFEKIPGPFNQMKKKVYPNARELFRVEKWN